MDSRADETKLDFYQSLKSATVPWPDKVKLVRYGWKHEAVVLVDKHQFILDWIANKVIHSRKKFKLCDEDALAVWSCLNDVLASVECQVPRGTRSLQINPHILQAVVTELCRDLSNESHVDLEIVASCSQRLLSSSFSKSILLSDCRTLANLLAVALQLFTRESLKGEVPAELSAFLSLVVDCCQMSLKWHPDQNAFFVELTLLPAVEFLLAMRNSADVSEREKVESLLWSYLFDRFSMPKWTLALQKLVSWKDEENTTPGKAPRLVEVTFQKIQEGFKVENNAPLLHFLPLFFRNFIRLAKTDDTNVWDRLLVHLGSLSGFLRVDTNPDAVEMSLALLARLLEVAVDTGVYETCNANVESMKTWLHKLIEWVLRLETRSRNWFSALKLLVKLDHTLFDRMSSILLRTAWLQCKEPESSEAQGELVAEIFVLYNLLRLVPGLIHKLMLALTQSTDAIPDITWPEQLNQRLASIVGNLPQSSIVEIWTDLLDGVTGIVDDASKDTVTAALCKLLSIVIVNCQLIGANITNLTMQSAEKLMERTWSDVISKLLTRLTIKKKTSANILSVHSLELLHAYGELHSLLSLQSLKYSPAQNFPPEVPTALALNDLSILFQSIDSSEWNELLKKCLNAPDKRVAYLHRQLLIQKLRLLLVLPSSDAVQLSITNVVDYLIPSSEMTDASEAWNGQLATISHANHVVASWQQLLPCLPMILSSVSAEQLKTVAQFLLTAHLSPPADNEDPFSVNSLSEHFMKTSVSQEMLALHSALNTSVWEKIASVLSGDTSSPNKSKKRKHGSGVKAITSILTSLTSGCENQTDEELSEAFENIHDQLSLIGELPVGVISDEGAEIISKVLGILLLLPLRYWSKSLMLQCLTGLLASAPIAIASKHQGLRSVVLALLAANMTGNPASRQIIQHFDCAAYLHQVFSSLEMDVKPVMENVFRLNSRYPVGVERLTLLLEKLKEEKNSNSRRTLLLLTQVLSESVAVKCPTQDSCKELFQSLLDQNLFLKPEAEEKAATLAAFSCVLSLGQTDHLDVMCRVCLGLLEEKQDLGEAEAVDACAAFLKALSSSEELTKGLPEAFLPSAWHLLQLHVLTALGKQEDLTFSRSPGEIFVQKNGAQSDVFISSIEQSRQSVVLMADQDLRTEIWQHADAVFTSEAAVHHPSKVILALRTCQLLMEVDASKSLLQEVLVKCQHVALRTRSVALMKQLLQFQAHVLSFGIRYFKGNSALMILKTCAHAPVADTSLPLDVFHVIFKGVQQILLQLITQFKDTTLTNVPSFLDIVSLLLMSLIRRSYQGNSASDKKNLAVLLDCSTLLERLFGLIAHCKARMADVVAFLIARYVDEVQTSSLIPEMKRSLLVCMHTLLTVCDDFTIAHLNATLPSSVTHIFQKLYSEYIEHYKFSGKI